MRPGYDVEPQVICQTSVVTVMGPDPDEWVGWGQEGQQMQITYANCPLTAQNRGADESYPFY